MLEIVKTTCIKLKIQNNFFKKNGKLYIIYPYGNTTATTEMDIVII